MELRWISAKEEEKQSIGPIGVHNEPNETLVCFMAQLYLLHNCSKGFYSLKGAENLKNIFVKKKKKRHTLCCSIQYHTDSLGSIL